MLVWPDYTVAYNAKRILFLISDETSCMVMFSVKAQSSGVHDARPRYDEVLYVYPFMQNGSWTGFESVYLCERKIEETKDKNRLPALAARLNSTLPRHMKFERCLKGHYTHSFMATDPQAYCWPLGRDLNDKHSRVLFLHKGDNSSSTATPASAALPTKYQDKMTAPPMFFLRHRRAPSALHLVA
jgi:hypothetical protein